MLIHKSKAGDYSLALRTTGPPVVKYSHCSGLGFQTLPNMQRRRSYYRSKPRAKRPTDRGSGQDKHQ